MSSTEVDAAAEPLRGRSEPAYEVENRHAVLGTPLMPPFPAGIEVAYFALGCYWAAERLFWQVDVVYTTASGYVGGTTPNPTGEEVESGRTGHAEAVLVAFDPARVSFAELVRIFFEAHDPTQGMRQGYEVGTHVRSGVHCTSASQRATAESMRSEYDRALRADGWDPITTEVEAAGTFYYGPDEEQQYLHKQPQAVHCALAGTGVACG